MKNLKMIGATLCVAALAVPAAVSAKKPDNPGSNGKGHSNTHVNQRCKHQPKVGYTFGGTLGAGSTLSALNVTVTHASHAAKSLNGTTVQLSQAPYSFTGAPTINGTSPFDSSGNLNAGVDPSKYTVQVVGKIVKFKKGCNVDNTPAPITIRKVVINAPDANSNEQSGTQQGTQQS